MPVHYGGGPEDRPRRVQLAGLEALAPVGAGDRHQHDLIERRASSVAAVFSRLGGDVPLPLVAHELARHGVPVFPCAPGGKRPIPDRG